MRFMHMPMGGVTMSDMMEVEHVTINAKTGEKSVTITMEPIVPPSIEEIRASMVCSPAQMRLSLLSAGLLDQVQGIADSDPAASIVWEYATRIERLSPLVDALGGPNGFSPEQIDDIFRAAMQVQV